MPETSSQPKPTMPGTTSAPATATGLHRTPRHVVLLLSADEARLLEVQGEVATPVHGSKFPMVNEDVIPRPRDDLRFLRGVDEALGTYLRLHPAPLVVGAAEPTASAFTRLSRNLGRMAGVVPGNHLQLGLHEIASLSRPVLADYLAGRQDEALDLLSRRTDQGRAAYGIDAVWQAVRREQVEMLAVDPTFFYPARLSEDGDRLTPAEDVGAPDVIDDAVDEVIEQVLDRRGWVALVEPGTLPEGRRIALTLREV